MAIISGQMAKLFDARIGKAFFGNLKLYPEEYAQWCDKRTTKEQYECDAMFGEFPMPNLVGEYENAPETHFSPGPQRTWTPVKYAVTLIASEEIIEDERFPVVVKSAGALGTAMRHRYETQGAYDLNNSFTVSTVGAADTADETLCATAHASFGDGSDQANRPATDVTLGVDSLWAAVVNFHGLNDREDNPIMKIPNKLVFGPTLERRAIEILRSDAGVPYLSTNEMNAIRSKNLGYSIGHYIDSVTAWWVTTAEKSIRFYVRRAPTVKAESTIRNDSRSWTISTRISHGPMDWYDIYGTDGVA